MVGQRGVPAWRLASEAFLLRESGSETRRMVEDFFIQQSLAVMPAMEVNSNEAIKHGVQAGFGVAIVPSQSVIFELQRGQLATIDVAAMHLQYAWCVVHRQEKRFSRVAESFKDFVLQEGWHHLTASRAASESRPAAIGPEVTNDNGHST